MMVGVVVDGDSELVALPLQLAKLAPATGNTYRIVKANVHPMAPAGAAARACLARVRLLEAKGAERTLIVLDRETRPECPGILANALVTAINRLGCQDVFVVIKDRTFENWLLGDLDALAAQPRRFSVSRALRRAIEPNKADSVEALTLIKRAVHGSYDKYRDGERILQRAEPIRIARHSRSYRKFLQAAGHPRYSAQTSRP